MLIFCLTFWMHIIRFKRAKSRPLRMEVNAYQAAILLLFNRAGVDPEAGLTLTEIASSESLVSKNSLHHDHVEK